MKKLMIVAALIISTAAFAGCGNDNSGKNENTNLANTDVNITESSTEKEAESSLPDKTEFEKIPDEAVDSFDYMVEATKKIYIQETSKRFYGYIGTETVENDECYVFELYDVEDSLNEKVATVAVSKNAETIYVYNERSEEYSVLEVPEDSSSQTESQWSDSVTASFADYLNSESDKDDSSASGGNISSDDESAVKSEN